MMFDLSTEFLWGVYFGGMLTCFALMTHGRRGNIPAWAMIFAIFFLSLVWPVAVAIILARKPAGSP